MVESLVNEYQKWNCGAQDVILGIRNGIALFARCTCDRNNIQSEVYFENSLYNIWSYESSRCIHTVTVLANYYASKADSDLETERVDD